MKVVTSRWRSQGGSAQGLLRLATTLGLKALEKLAPIMIGTGAEVIMVVIATVLVVPLAVPLIMMGECILLVDLHIMVVVPEENALAHLHILPTKVQCEAELIVLILTDLDKDL